MLQNDDFKDPETMLKKLFKYNIAETHSFRYLFYFPAMI